MSLRPPLWAPWRMEYIQADKAGACIFCEPETPRSDRERLILHRSSQVLILLNRYPYAAGHLMVAPAAHTARLWELDAAAQSEVMARLADAARILEGAYDCEGMNIGLNLGTAAGAGFADHLHFHLVPRWLGDTNYITVLGDTRVIPEHLEASYEKLAVLFQELDP